MESFGMRLVPFLEWLVWTSVQASILILLILLVKLVLRHHLSARFHYWLWVLLLIRLILPSAPQSRLSLFKLVPRELTSRPRSQSTSSNRIIQEQRASTEAPSVGGIENAADQMRMDKIVLPKAGAGVAQGAARDRMPYAPRNSRSGRTVNKRQASTIAALIWLAIAGGLGTLVVVRSFLVWWAIRGERPVADPRILDLLEDCKMEVGVQTLLCVIVSNRVRSPALLGYIRPRIVLPDGLLESVSLDEIHDVFIHELSHLKRCDVYLSWVATLAQIVHWFNPLIWFACRRMWLDREMACDELAIAAMDSSEDADRYARTLVNLAEKFRSLERLPSLAALAENSYKIEKRIRAIAQAPERSRLSGVYGMMIVLLLSVLGLTDAPARSESSESGLLLLQQTSAPTDETLRVPSEYGTIQAAIDAAFPGDKIKVAPGTYYEAINFNGKNVHLYSTGATINGNGADHVVICVGVGSGAILEGFTITGGSASGSSFPHNNGGGMFNNGASPTVINCTFTGNSANGNGGGMYNWRSGPTVTDCTFTENTAMSGYGGAMCNAESKPTVTNCTFIGNTADPGGGGMYNHVSSPEVTDCTFTGNLANDGAGMHNRMTSYPTVTNCSFTGNTAANRGGGMYNWETSLTVTNCTFTNNSAASGGGMYNNTCNPSVTNCILWNDTSDEIAEILGTATVTYSNVQGGRTGTGNIDADPMFADTDGRLLPGSPCVDAGDNGAVPVDIVTDLDGNRRVADGDHSGSEDIDIGAYEVQWPIDNATQGT